MAVKPAHRIVNGLKPKLRAFRPESVALRQDMWNQLKRPSTKASKLLNEKAPTRGAGLDSSECRVR